MHPNASTYEPWVQEWLTDDRFKTYLQAAGNDTQRAFDLYQWNAALNAALLHDFAHLEVILRNSLHRALQDFVTPGLSWSAYEPSKVLFPETHRTGRSGSVYDANKWLRDTLHASRTKFQCSHSEDKIPPRVEGKIVADLTFRFWQELLHSRFEGRLWTRALRKAFSPGVARGDVYERLVTLSQVRNRLAHHEPNLKHANKAHRDLFWVLSVIDRRVQVHVRNHSSVGKLLSSRP